MVIERPDMDLVGVRVYNPSKVGQDAGTFIDVPETGVVATDDVDAILALDADCVCYSPLGSTLADHESALDDICRLLASGKNVVSSAAEHQAYLRPDFELAGAGTKALERLKAACTEGESTFFHVGINPGFTMDLWPITLSRLCRRIDRITITEIVDMSTYTSEHIVRDRIGFGRPPGEEIAFEKIDPEESTFSPSFRMVGDAMGITFDELRYSQQVAVTSSDLPIAVGTIKTGTVAAIRKVIQGVLRGHPVLSFELVWRISPDVAPEWPNGDSRWALHIEGDPMITSEIELATNTGTKRATSLVVATLLLNAVPTVCGSPPGLLDNLTMPLHAGGYFSA
jgi:4-hydroxy-tetrahydrodipicolinate reductase